MRLIDADALMDELRENYKTLRDGLDHFSFNAGISRAITVTNEMPMIKPKQGEWIKNHDVDSWWYECSVCGEKPLRNNWSDTEALSKYCPSCGARNEVANEVN